MSPSTCDTNRSCVIWLIHSVTHSCATWLVQFVDVRHTNELRYTVKRVTLYIRVGCVLDTHTPTNPNTHTRTHAHTHTRTHAHTHTRTHTHSHTHTHTLDTDINVSRINASCHTYKSVMSHTHIMPYVWHDICVAWLIHMCGMTHPYVWHDSSICVAWLIHMCGMTHPYVCHDSLISSRFNPLTEEITSKILASPDWTVFLSTLLSDGDSRLLPWKLVWKFGDSRQILFESYGDSRENLLKFRQS